MQQTSSLAGRKWYSRYFAIICRFCSAYADIGVTHLQIESESMNTNRFEYEWFVNGAALAVAGVSQRCETTSVDAGAVATAAALAVRPCVQLRVSGRSHSSHRWLDMQPPCWWIKMFWSSFSLFRVLHYSYRSLFAYTRNRKVQSDIQPTHTHMHI